MPDLVTPWNVANFLLAESRERGELLTNLKLQKLLYYAQAWHLALKGKPLFGEDFQAWVHGPVLPSQYRRFRDFQWKPLVVEVEASALTDELHAFLVEIVDVFGPESAVSLELMTHREAPWIEARHGLPANAPSTSRIPKDSMRAFYRTLADS